MFQLWLYAYQTKASPPIALGGDQEYYTMTILTPSPTVLWWGGGSSSTKHILPLLDSKGTPNLAVNKISQKQKHKKQNRKFFGGGLILFLTLFIKQHPVFSFFDATVFPGFIAFDLYRYSHFQTFSFRRLGQNITGHQKVKHWICCCYCIPWVPSFYLIYIKPQFKKNYFWRSFRSLEVVRGDQMVKHWICCCYSIPWVPSFRLICIKPQQKYFLFVDVIKGH